jgi:hypothetical protein
MTFVQQMWTASRPKASDQLSSSHQMLESVIRLIINCLESHLEGNPI